MTDSSGHRKPPEASAPEPQKDQEPVVSKPYVMPDDPEPGSAEAKLYEVFLKPRDWLGSEV